MGRSTALPASNGGYEADGAITNLSSRADNHDVLTRSDSNGPVCTATSCSPGGMGGGSTESGCAPGYNLNDNGGPQATGTGSVGDGGGYGAIYCLAGN
ncbi:MAG TPA: hypothetical protein VIV60_37685 [Polyangiaceae bacterium]